MALKQMKNELHVKGRLKTKNLELKETRVPGVFAITGGLVVEFKDDNGNINNVEGSVYVKDTKNNGEHNKMFDSYETIMEEYVSVDELAKNGGNTDLADVVDINAEINSNDYISSRSGALVSTNNIRVNFVNRVSPNNRDGFEAGATGNIEVVVDKFIDEIREDEPTGRKKVIAYTVGYGERVSQLQNLYVGEDLAEQFEEMYYKGSNGIITVKVKHFSEIKEIESDLVTQQTGFGQTDNITREVTNWTNELEVIGGFLPFEDEKAVSEDDFKKIKSLREQFLAEKKATAGTQSVNPVGGFGSNAKKVEDKVVNPFQVSGNTAIDISESDLPF